VRRLNDGKLYRPHPKFLTGAAVEAIQVSLLSLVFRTGDEDAPMRNDGTAVTGPWKSRLPADVFPRSPMERRFVFLGDTVPVMIAATSGLCCNKARARSMDSRARLNSKD